MRQFGDECLFLLYVRISLYYCRLLDVVRNFILYLIIYLCFLWNLIEYFQIAVLLQIVWSDFWYNRTHSIDVVSQDDATHGLNKDHTKGLLLIGGDNITKADSQHDSNSPVVPPDILLIPLRVVKPLINQPVFFVIEPCHCNEGNRETMCNNKIEQKDLDEIPDFLSILILNQLKLNMSQHHQQRFNLQHYN